MSELVEKPPHGSPCNGCGVCCMVSLCPLAEAVFPTEKAPCPALVNSEDGRRDCGLVLHPQEYRPTRARIHGVGKMRQAALRLIGAGHGCDAYYGEANEAGGVDHVFRQKLYREATKPSSRKAAKVACRIWGV